MPLIIKKVERGCGKVEEEERRTGRGAGGGGLEGMEGEVRERRAEAYSCLCSTSVLLLEHTLAKEINGRWRRFTWKLGQIFGEFSRFESNLNENRCGVRSISVAQLRRAVIYLVLRFLFLALGLKFVISRLLKIPPELSHLHLQPHSH